MTSVRAGRANGHDEPRVTQCVFEGEAKDTRGRPQVTPLTWWNTARGRASKVDRCLHRKKTKEAEWSGPTSHDPTR